MIIHNILQVGYICLLTKFFSFFLVQTTPSHKPDIKGLTVFNLVWGRLFWDMHKDPARIQKFRYCLTPYPVDSGLLTAKEQDNCFHGRLLEAVE
jgi:hypothetical protein